MTVSSKTALKIRLKLSDMSKEKKPRKGSSTKETSNSSSKKSKPAAPSSSSPTTTTDAEKPQEPPAKQQRKGMSKETRRERNRITAKESRDRKVKYIAELENSLHQAKDRIAQLEYEASGICPIKREDIIQQQVQQQQTPDIFFIHTSQGSGYYQQLNPEQMGFFD